MTASDIMQIVVTVAIAQFTCDMIAYWRIYSSERYERALAAFGRAKWKKDKAAKDATELGIDLTTLDAGEAAAASGGKQKSNNKVSRATKAYERADQDCKDANTVVTQKHMAPNMLTSILFVILMRILGTEHKGNIMAIIPFSPWAFFQRITSRGLEFDPDLAFEPLNGEDSLVTDASQAASFVFIYMLTGLSVKFYVNQLFGTKPPAGSAGMMGLAESTWGKKMLASVGMDPNDLKMD